MDNHRSALRVCWLADPAAVVPPSVIPVGDLFQRLDFPIPPEIGSGWLERLRISDGLNLVLGVNHFRTGATGQLVPLGEFQVDYLETTLAVQTVSAGAVCHREFLPKGEFIFKPGYDFFRRSEGLRNIPLIDSMSDTKMTGLFVSDSAMSRLLGEDVAQGLIAWLGLSKPPVAKVLPIPLHISNPLRASMSSEFVGSLKILHAHSKVLEYLCLLTAYGLAQTTKQLPTSPRNRRKREKMAELHAYLIQLEGRIPTLEVIGSRFDRSARWLNDDFAKAYGQTIYAFLVDHRLKEAHSALIVGDVPIKTISERMGYSNVSNFTCAFKKKFGYPPGYLRRHRRAEDKR
jgi:AraC-like DNA-binding protein